MPSKLYSTLFELQPGRMKNFKMLHSNNRSGFIIADFLFALVLVVSCGIIIFALTFSLATVEIAQYIVWSSARNYSAANETEDAAARFARAKFKNLADQFPLLTGHGSNSTPWVTMGDVVVGNLAGDKPLIDQDLRDKLQTEIDNKSGGQFRQPWIGAKSELTLNLFRGLKFPFLGPVASPSSTAFTFPIRAFILRHPSQSECQKFFFKENRFDEGIQKITGEEFGNIESIHTGSIKPGGSYVPIEDNGC